MSVSYYTKYNSSWGHKIIYNGIMPNFTAQLMRNSQVLKNRKDLVKSIYSLGTI